jgi:uncharacterized protein
VVHLFETLGKEFVFFFDVVVFVHDEHHFPSHPAQAAFCLDPGGSEILFAHGDTEPFGQKFEFIVNLMRFHSSESVVVANMIPDSDVDYRSMHATVQYLFHPRQNSMAIPWSQNLENLNFCVIVAYTQPNRRNSMHPVSAQQTRAQVQVNSFVRSVYNWMAIGLGLTAVTAFAVAGSETLIRLIFGNPIVFFGLIIGELALVFTISSRVHRMRAATATNLFILYAVLNGATLSAIFLRYTASSIASTFVVCSLTFLSMSIYGWTTKKDLTSWGNFLFMGLIGIVIASVVNIFVQSSGMAMIISYIGVLVFVGLTAYDTQKIKQMAASQPADVGAGAVRKGAILGALSLYLDFINLFLMLLHILGNRD